MNQYNIYYNIFTIWIYTIHSFVKTKNYVAVYTSITEVGYDSVTDESGNSNYYSYIKVNYTYDNSNYTNKQRVAFRFNKKIYVNSKNIRYKLIENRSKEYINALLYCLYML